MKNKIDIHLIKYGTLRMMYYLIRLETFQFNKAVSDTVLDINAVYHDKPLIFIKAVTDTVLDLINIVYHDKPLIFIKALSDTVLYIINTVYFDKPLIFIGVRFLLYPLSIGHK